MVQEKISTFSKVLHFGVPMGMAGKGAAKPSGGWELSWVKQSLLSLQTTAPAMFLVTGAKVAGKEQPSLSLPCSLCSPHLLPQTHKHSPASPCTFPRQVLPLALYLHEFSTVTDTDSYDGIKHAGGKLSY